MKKTYRTQSDIERIKQIEESAIDLFYRTARMLTRQLATDQVPSGLGRIAAISWSNSIKKDLESIQQQDLSNLSIEMRASGVGYQCYSHMKMLRLCGRTPQYESDPTATEAHAIVLLADAMIRPPKDDFLDLPRTNGRIDDW